MSSCSKNCGGTLVPVLGGATHILAILKTQEVAEQDSSAVQESVLLCFVRLKKKEFYFQTDLFYITNRNLRSARTLLAGHL